MNMTALKKRLFSRLCGLSIHIPFQHLKKGKNGIWIFCGKGIYEITLPCLLPKRRQSQSTEYLIDPLTAALEQYVKGHTVRRFRHCVVCFSHTYCQDLPERRVRAASVDSTS